jgi:hypothetical protein
MQFKEFLSESFNKEYGYRVKFAYDCGADQMTALESCLAKYNFVSAAPFKRQPIQENPIEFVRAKGVSCVSEVCSTDVVLKYPVNPRILEVWLSVNLGMEVDRVLVYEVNDPRRVESDIQQARVANDKDRFVNEEDAELAKEEMAHYEDEQEQLDDSKDYGFGEEHNAKFLAELQRIKDEKGSDYFRNYPSKDELMGDDLRPTYDAIMNIPNMGKGAESTKEVDSIRQSGGGRV